MRPGERGFALHDHTISHESRPISAKRARDLPVSSPLGKLNFINSSQFDCRPTPFAPQLLVQGQ
jgi:hypothetical protein